MGSCLQYFFSIDDGDGNDDCAADFDDDSTDDGYAADEMLS